MDKVPLDEVKAALNEQETHESAEEPSASTEETSEVTEETEEVSSPVPQGVPQSRVDQIVAEREQVKAEKAQLEAQLAEVRELEQMGYSVKDIKNYVSSTGTASQLDSVRSKREAQELRQSVQELKQGAELSEYLASNPSAKTLKKALSGLKRSNPNKSYEQLFRENFSEIPLQKQKVKVETGRSSIDESVSSDVPTEKFAKMTLAEQKAYLDQRGGTFPKGGRL